MAVAVVHEAYCGATAAPAILSLHGYKSDTRDLMCNCRSDITFQDFNLGILYKDLVIWYIILFIKL